MKVLIAGYYGFGNLGDELILASILTQVRARYAEPNSTVLSGDPLQTASAHRVNAVSRWNPFRIVREVWNNDFMILGGGGLLQNKTSSAPLYYYLSLIAVARLLQCPVVLYAMGVESLTGRLDRFLTRFALSGEGVTITVRDSASRQVLRDIGLTKKEIPITADPVFTFQALRVPKERYAFPSASVLMIPRFPCPPSGRRLFAIMGRILKEEKKIQVQGMLFQPQVENDHLSQFSGEAILSECDFLSGLPFDEMADRVGQFDWVISARFHGLVLAALSGRPFIGVGDADKVGRICAELKMPYLPWDATEEEAKAALEKISLHVADSRFGEVSRLQDAARLTVGHLR